MELGEAGEKPLASGEEQVRQRYVFSVATRVEQRIAYIAIANLLALNVRDIESLCVIRAHQAEVDCRCGLQLHFKKLMAHVRELPVVPVVGVAEALAHQPV